jgi:hypothetical protein
MRDATKQLVISFYHIVLLFFQLEEIWTSVGGFKNKQPCPKGRGIGLPGGNRACPSVAQTFLEPMMIIEYPA